MISVRMFTVLATVVALVLGLVTACAPEAGVKLPEVTFSADSYKIVEGECTYLNWQVTGLGAGDTVHVDGEQVKPSGDKKVCPTESKTYFLNVKANGQTFHGDDLWIEVVPPKSECTENEECCDLHKGEVWECDDDKQCVKVECETSTDCKEICPIGEWECDDLFGECVKATPTPKPECTGDADCDPDADEECVDGECVKPTPTPTPSPTPVPEPDEPPPPLVLTETKLIGSVPKDIDMGVVVHRFDHRIYGFSGWFNGTGCGDIFSEAVPKVCENYVEVADGQVGADGAFSLTTPLGPTFVWYATGVDQDGQVVIAFAMAQVDTTDTTKQETLVEIEWRYCGIDF